MKTLQAIGVGFGLAVGFAAAVVGFIMFGAAAMTSSEAKPDVAAAPAPARTREPAALPAPQQETTAPATPKLPGLTVAVFRDDVLSECVEYALAVPPEAEAKGPPVIDAMAEKLLANTDDGAKPIRLQKSCDEQFADRPALGACNVTIDLSAKVKDAQLFARSRQYDTRLVGDNDVAMKDCLKMGGDWTANAEAVERAQSEQRMQRRARQLERLTGSN